MFQILIYGFPVVLLGFEWGLRLLVGVDAEGFTGPSLAAAGLSHLVPLTKPKVLNIPLPEHPGAMVTSKHDQNAIIPLAFFFIFVSLSLWAWACYVSITNPHGKTLGLATHLEIGSLVYVISLVMIFAKEKA